MTATKADGLSLDTFGGRLRHARELRRFGSRELGETAGLSYAAVSALEGDPDANPTLKTIRALGAALSTDPAWLAFGVGKAPVETAADRAREPPVRGRHRD
jgi:transcriptional regulator with XRE-family HTH domain